MFPMFYGVRSPRSLTPDFVSVLSSHLAQDPSLFLIFNFLLLHLAIRMGRFAKLVGTLEAQEAFKTKYNIPARVGMEHCHLGE